MIAYLICQILYSLGLDVGSGQYHSNIPTPYQDSKQPTQPKQQSFMVAVLANSSSASRLPVVEVECGDRPPCVVVVYPFGIVEMSYCRYPAYLGMWEEILTFVENAWDCQGCKQLRSMSQVLWLEKYVRGHTKNPTCGRCLWCHVLFKWAASELDVVCWMFKWKGWNIYQEGIHPPWSKSLWILWTITCVWQWCSNLPSR